MPQEHDVTKSGHFRLSDDGRPNPPLTRPSRPPATLRPADENPARRLTEAIVTGIIAGGTIELVKVLAL